LKKSAIKRWLSFPHRRLLFSPTDRDTKVLLRKSRE